MDHVGDTARARQFIMKDTQPNAPTHVNGATVLQQHQLQQ